MNINASSLFHFTNCIDNLCSILENGLRFSFCEEIYPQTLIFNHLNPNKSTDFFINNQYPTTIGIPMISFCDIPLARINKHTNKYGSFGIGFNKEFLISLYKGFLNPIFYVNNYNIDYALVCLSQFKSQKIIEGGNCNGNSTNDKSEKFINSLISYVKPYYRKNTDGKIEILYDEREWRIVYPDGLRKGFQWIWDTREKTIDEANKYLHSTENPYMDILEGCNGYWLNQYITNIIVSKNSEKSIIIDMILKSKKILGIKNISIYDKYELIGKVISLEQIENDF